ncbi:MAG TPA: DUF3710 domain-containing protein [Candidatus Limnocylindrales bacterium]|nr:DUF3710 domain-containing protein [Candidatus Limnocylindrales bacterium]
MIFSRRSRAGRHAKAEALLGELELKEPAQAPVAPAPDEETGPYDLSGAPGGLRIDLGSLQIPAIDGVEIRAQAGEDGVIQQLELANGANALQLGVFAAPRTESLWEEIRPEIRKALSTDGVGAEEVPGRWGTELRARLRTPQGFDDLRFVGIDGPRWMVRAVFRGPAAADPALAGPLDDCLTGLVVNRDDQARPTREALPLRLPTEVPAAPEPGAAEAPAAVAEVPRRKTSPRPRKN